MDTSAVEPYVEAVHQVLAKMAKEAEPYVEKLEPYVILAKNELEVVLEAAKRSIKLYAGEINAALEPSVGEMGVIVIANIALSLFVALVLFAFTGKRGRTLTTAAAAPSDMQVSSSKETADDSVVGKVDAAAVQARKVETVIATETETESVVVRTTVELEAKVEARVDAEEEVEAEIVAEKEVPESGATPETVEEDVRTTQGHDLPVLEKENEVTEDEEVPEESVESSPEIEVEDENEGKDSNQTDAQNSPSSTTSSSFETDEALSETEGVAEQTREENSIVSKGRKSTSRKSIGATRIPSAPLSDTPARRSTRARKAVVAYSPGV